MKSFFGDVFIGKQKNENVRIKYPIKIEYYKTKDEENNMYGIEIIKKEYKRFNTKVEGKSIFNVTSNESEAERLLTLFKNNKVTTTGAEDIIQDILKSTCKI